MYWNELIIENAKEIRKNGLRSMSYGYCYPKHNASCIKLLLQPDMYVFLYIFATIVTIVTIFGNLFVIISVSHFKQLHTPTNFLVLSLAVADFLIGLLVMPFQFFGNIEYCWYYGNIFCYIYVTYYYLLIPVSTSNLILISVDRYLAVCNPFFYSNKITIPVTSIGIVAVWVISIIYTMVFLYFSGGEIVTYLCAGYCRLHHFPEWAIIYNVVSFFFPFTIMICLYSRIFIVAKRHARAINCAIKQIEFINVTKSTVSKPSERKAAKKLGIVNGVFMICWLPNLLLTLYLCYVGSSSLIVYDLLDGLSWLSQINSGLNPIMYALFYPWFRRSLKLLITFSVFKADSSVLNLFPAKPEQ